MSYSFERLRFHFIEQAVRQISEEGNTTNTVNMVIHTQRNQAIRLISARKASQHPRLKYGGFVPLTSVS